MSLVLTEERNWWGSILTLHQQTLTTVPFDNTCGADEVSPEVAIGGVQDAGVYNERK